MRNYKILKAKAEAFDHDEEIQLALQEAGASLQGEPTAPYSDDSARAIREHDYSALVDRSDGIGHERIDQLSLELIFGVR
jgi:xylose isomerase